MNQSIERRINQSLVKIETRSVGEGDDAREVKVARGYAAVFNKQSEDLGGFKEVIAPGAFDSVLEDDVRALFNHDANHVLGRTKSGTAKVFVDEEGLGYEVEMPDTQVGRDLVTLMERGDVTQSSFAFRVEEDEFITVEDEVVRTIKSVERLYDVSPVTYPAYPDATVALRSLNKFKDAQTKAEEERSKEEIEAMQMQATASRLRGAGSL